jgi:hypothetical protein
VEDAQNPEREGDERAGRDGDDGLSPCSHSLDWTPSRERPFSGIGFLEVLSSPVRM